MVAFLIVVVVVIIIIIIIIIAVVVVIISETRSRLINFPTEILHKPNLLPFKVTYLPVLCRDNLVELGSVDCCLESRASVVLPGSYTPVYG